jgi:hypothetical protein
MTTRRQSRRAVLAVAAALLGATIAAAEPVNRSRQGLAIDGYDPVAYFTESRALPGLPQLTHQHGGATYRFATEAHRDAFAADPARYLPQYGGFCAWAVSRGDTAPIDPEAWRIVDGRLYLNYSRSVQRMWEADVPANIRKGDANWPALRQK